MNWPQMESKPGEELPIKGIVSDSKDIFLWQHKSQDIDKKGLFPKF